MRHHARILATISLMALTFGCDQVKGPSADAAAPAISDEQLRSALAQAADLRKSRRAPQAVALLREAQKSKPANEDVLSQLGYALIAAGQPEEAVNVFDMLTAINHDSAAAYNGKAVAFDHSGNHIAAQEIYQKALSLAPTSPIIQNNLALSMILNEQPATAIGLLEPLAAQPGASPVMRHNLALAYGIKGDLPRARELNLRDMKPREADENERFYLHYSELMQKQKVAALAARMHPSLAAEPDDEAPEPVKLVNAPAAPSPYSRLEPSAGKASAPAAPKETITPEAGLNDDDADGTFWGYKATREFPTR